MTVSSPDSGNTDTPTAPRWTVDPDGFIGWRPETDEDGNVDWDEMIWPSDVPVGGPAAWAALVRCVRSDATLTQARELAAIHLDREAVSFRDRERAFIHLLDLLTEARESEPRILTPTDVCSTCANSGWVGSRSDPQPCRTCGRPTPTADELCPPGYWGWK